MIMDQWVVIDMMKMDQWVFIDAWCKDEDGSMSCHWYDEDGSMSCHWYDEDGSMSCHWYMMHSWFIWCNGGLMYRWLIIVLSWLIRCTNRWTPKWSPYGESPHGKTLCRLSYPRIMVGGPILVCEIMRARVLQPFF